MTHGNQFSVRAAGHQRWLTFRTAVTAVVIGMVCGSLAILQAVLVRSFLFVVTMGYSGSVNIALVVLRVMMRGSL